MVHDPSSASPPPNPRASTAPDPARAGCARTPCRRFRDSELAAAEDVVVVEEPLEIRIDGRPLLTTMRTPGGDRELALGLLLCEGWLAGPQDVETLVHCGRGAARTDHDRATSRANVVDLRRSPAARRRMPPPEARLPATSSCGVCGKRSIADVLARTPLARTRLAPRAADPSVRRESRAPGRIAAALLGDLPERLRAAQEIFDLTGGLHAAGLFDPSGALLVAREDIGRHNAVDKVLGWSFLEGRLPLADAVLQVSGRASFEIVQKAHAAGVPLVSAVSGVSSLAIELARVTGITLIGFAREGRLTVYTHADRVDG